MSLRTSLIGASYLKLIEKYLLPHITRSGVSANQVTILGVALAALVPIALYLKPSLGLGAMIVSGIADSLDGMVARKLNRVTEYGTFLDSSLDRVSDCFYLLGVWILFWQFPGKGLSTPAVFIALMATYMISYTKARAEGLGIHCRVGIMSREVRVLFLIMWYGGIVLAPSQARLLLWIGLAGYVGLTLFTVIQRMVHVRCQIRNLHSGNNPECVVDTEVGT